MHHSHNFLQKNQIWEQFVSDNVRNEVDLLKSRTNIAETLLTEKTKQLDLVQKQVEMLKQHLLSADQLNKEQAIMIESLRRRLNGGGGGRRENGNGTSNNGKLIFKFVKRHMIKNHMLKSSEEIQNGIILATLI